MSLERRLADRDADLERAQKAYARTLAERNAALEEATLLDQRLESRYNGTFFSGVAALPPMFAAGFVAAGGRWGFAGALILLGFVLFLRVNAYFFARRRSVGELMDVPMSKLMAWDLSIDLEDVIAQAETEARMK